MVPLALAGLSIAANLAQGVASKIGDALSTHADAAKDAAKTAAAGKTRKTADDFESMFLENSLDRLTQNTGEDGPLGANGEGGGVYRSMLVKEYAGKIQKAGGVGIADQVYRQMLQMQENSGAAR